MGKRAPNIVIESEKELRALLKKQKNKTLQARLQALLYVVTEPHLTRNQVAVLVGVNKRSLERWFTTYKSGGMSALLSIKPKAPKKSKITPELHLAIQKKLSDTKKPMRTYYDLQKWLLEKHEAFINYQTLRAYVIRNFGKKLKVKRSVLFIKDKHYRDSHQSDQAQAEE